MFICQHLTSLLRCCYWSSSICGQTNGILHSKSGGGCSSVRPNFSVKKLPLFPLHPKLFLLASLLYWLTITFIFVRKIAKTFLKEMTKINKVIYLAACPIYSLLLDSGAVYTLALKTHVGMSIQTWRYFAGWCDKVMKSSSTFSSVEQGCLHGNSYFISLF